jgi:hypothetical protein
MARRTAEREKLTLKHWHAHIGVPNGCHFVCYLCTQTCAVLVLVVTGAFNPHMLVLCSGKHCTKLPAPEQQTQLVWQQHMLLLSCCQLQQIPWRLCSVEFCHQLLRRHCSSSATYWCSRSWCCSAVLRAVAAAAAAFVGCGVSLVM